MQDKVYNAVQKIATQRGYDFVLDKSEGITVIFADPKLDKSDDILKETSRCARSVTSIRKLMTPR